jgi:hypothetical protein
MSSRSRSVFLAVVFANALVCSPLCAGEPFRFPEAKHGKGELQYVNGLPVLTVEGTPEEIGEQVAVLAIKPARRLLNYPQEIVSFVATPAGMKLIWPVCLKQGEKLLDNFPADHRKELETIITVSGFDRGLLVTANTIFDLKHLLRALVGCSALVVEAPRSQTGEPIFGRNMDYQGLGYLQEYSLVTIYRPKGKHAFAAIGYPGMIGIVSGINDTGLAVTALETTGAPKEEGPVFSLEGTPFALCYRRLLEECTTVEEAEKLLRGMKRCTTNNLTVCDKTSSAVFEFTPTRLVARRPEKGMSTCTNHFCTAELKLAEPKNDYATLDRYATLCKARDEQKKLGIADVQRYLDAANQGELTLQTMIFEPVTLTLHLATAAGKAAASSQKLKRLELAPFLKDQRAEK